MDSEEEQWRENFARSPMGRGYTLADAYDIKQTQGRDISRITLQNDSKEMGGGVDHRSELCRWCRWLSTRTSHAQPFMTANLELAINRTTPTTKPFAAITPR